MDLEKQLNKHLKRLNKAIRKLISRGTEFKELRSMLREGQVELAIYVVPMINGKATQGHEELKFELSDSDRTFLKDAGIRF